jgi:hypothetical protein
MSKDKRTWVDALREVGLRIGLAAIVAGFAISLFRFGDDVSFIEGLALLALAVGILFYPRRLSE